MKIRKQHLFLLPVVSTLYFFYKGYKFIGMYIDDFFQTIRLMTVEEREIYFEKHETEKAACKEQAEMIALAFISMVIYWFIFGAESSLNVITKLCGALVYQTVIELWHVAQHLQMVFHNIKG